MPQPIDSTNQALKIFNIREFSSKVSFLYHMDKLSVGRTSKDKKRILYRKGLIEKEMKILDMRPLVIEARFIL